MGTARHRARKRRPTEVIAAVVGVAGVVVVSAAVLTSDRGEPDEAAEVAETVAGGASCATTLRIVTATSFQRVLSGVAPLLESGEECARLEVELSDGRSADERVAELNADLWIPDDAAWAGIANSADLDANAPDAGTVLATSPIYMVTDDATADLVDAAGGSWLSLSVLAANEPDVELVVRDPASSGDGMVAAGAVGEAVWLEDGMDASAAALVAAFPAIRTVPEHAVPTDEGDIGLVPEHALRSLVDDEDATDGLDATTMLPGSDYSAEMRYTWQPTTAASDDPALAAAMDRLLSVLTGSEADDALADAGLRRADGTLPAGLSDEFPEPEAEPFEVLGPHHVEHVFATWYAEDRLSDVLVVVDISGSMAEPASGSDTPLIDLVRNGVGGLSELLPDESEFELWEFGSQLDPPRDYEELLPRRPLDGGHRDDLADALASLETRSTGTGLYDTMLAGYLTGRDNYRDGIPNQVIVFTDGTNEDDPDSVTAEELTEELAAAHDSERPVQLTVITYGPESQAQVLADVMEPVDSYVAHLTAAADVRTVFLHLAAGGIHQ